MAGQPASQNYTERRQVLGIRVTPDLRRQVKVEAAQRGLTLAQLFEKMWEAYAEREDGKAQ